MVQRLVLAPRRRALIATVGAVALASLASFTRPFTWSANTLTAASYVAVLLFALSRYYVVAESPDATPTFLDDQARGWRRVRFWIVLAGTTVAWELVCLTGHPRREHPTLSSIINELDRTKATRGLFFFAWLALSLVMVST